MRITGGRRATGHPAGTLWWGRGSTRLGQGLAAWSDEGIRLLGWIEDQVEIGRDLAGVCASGDLLREDPAGAAMRLSLLEPGRGGWETRGTFVPARLDLAGSEFQRRVWEELGLIAAGVTTTYGELAARLGLPGGSRAVGAACAANRLAVLVPCHRVLRGDGGLGGYRWGIARKAALLEEERRALGGTFHVKRAPAFRSSPG